MENYTFCVHATFSTTRLSTRLSKGLRLLVLNLLDVKSVRSFIAMLGEVYEGSAKGHLAALPLVLQGFRACSLATLHQLFFRRNHKTSAKLERASCFLATLNWLFFRRNHKTSAKLLRASCFLAILHQLLFRRNRKSCFYSRHHHNMSVVFSRYCCS